MTKKSNKNSIALKMMEFIKSKRLFASITKCKFKIKSWSESRWLSMKWLKNLVKLTEKSEELSS